MSGTGVAAAVLVPLFYGCAAWGHRGFRRQPAVVKASTPDELEGAVEAAGGRSSVRTGVWLDLGFIAALTVPSGLLLARSERPELSAAAVLAAVVDLGENGLLLRALRDPGAATVRLLRRTSTLKYVAYGLLVVALSVGAWLEVS